MFAAHVSVRLNGASEMDSGKRTGGAMTGGAIMDRSEESSA
jgi:hypothetical protein